ncbi:deoxyribose-phosphate aldolase [Williamsoniiplasma somnilux]|uniref:Deoxyribose-phosphate aldolase n=1 Tax=Williamsoniiplasma somnilux TaxID=215578 RepID=A0A2K8NXY8_9MOLU|nr:deoxyribose-phosphate aldolase [Williamsoniiplasma somnilux]ATZ18416.1 deoxyribose-phosphate aldolase [Williamsoniiplasma somnilux]
MKLNKYIDHTLLKPEATLQDIEKLCNEAKKFDFATVCVNSYWTKTAKELLKGSDVKITNVIGFPLGAATKEAKAFEAADAIKNGADEIDMVINIGALKSKQYVEVLEDLKTVRKATKGKVLKVIFENCLLSKDEIQKACELSIKAGLDFVKTSTGFSKSGATLEDVKLMFDAVKGKAEVKAAGGVRTKEDALAMIKAGATRLGTSGGVAIVQGQEHKNGY